MARWRSVLALVCTPSRRALPLRSLLSGCAMTSGVMEAEDETYLISAHAAPLRGGTAGAGRLPEFRRCLVEHVRRLCRRWDLCSGACQYPLSLCVSAWGVTDISYVG
jgi:hypothetical protein